MIDRKNMSKIKSPYVSIGAVYDSPDLDLLRGVLADLDIQWSAEGSRVAGYEVYVMRADGEAVLGILREAISRSDSNIRMFLNDRPYGVGKAFSGPELERWENWRSKCYDEGCPSRSNKAEQAIA